MSSQSRTFQRQPEEQSFRRQGLTSSGNADLEIEDLIHSWRRIADPGLRQIALGVIRAMATR